MSETQTRAERLHLPAHKPINNKKKASKKKNAPVKAMNWRDISAQFEDMRDTAFGHVGSVEELTKSVRRSKQIAAIMNVVNRSEHPLRDEENGIEVFAVIDEAKLDRTSGNIILKIEGYTSYQHDTDGFLKYTSEYCEKNASVYDVIDSAFDALEDIMRRKYASKIMDISGEDAVKEACLD